MSLLWKGNREQNLLIIFKRPSPRHNKYIPCFAQSKIQYLNNKLPVYSKIFPQLISRSIEGISLLISRCRNVTGSMTVEASIVLPLFFFFFLNVGSAIEMMRLHGNLELALWNVGSRMAVYGHLLTESEMQEKDTEMIQNNELRRDVGVVLPDIVLSGTYVKGQVIDYLGEDYLEQSPLKKGAGSLVFLESDILNGGDTFEIIATYDVSSVSTLSGFRSFRMANKYYGHFWNGYEIPIEDYAQEEYVYVTENGAVYHLTDTCTHLKLSISRVSFRDAVSKRNANGKRYQACEKCCDRVVTNPVFITKEGDCYHFIRECSGLKRTIYHVPVSQVADYRVCSRCSDE